MTPPSIHGTCPRCQQRESTALGCCDACHLFPRQRVSAITVARIAKALFVVPLRIVDPLKVGFTGSRHGMTDGQKAWLDCFFEATRANGPVTFRHGDCMGSDDQADALAAHHGLQIILHPPDNLRARANCQLKRDAARVELPRKPYLVRNHDIVDRVDMLIAAPYEADMVQRSGTWATVRYAGKKDRPTVVIQPSGLAKLKNFPQE